MSEKKAKRPSVGEMDAESSEGSSGFGDWICIDTECGNVNFAKRNSCNRCGKDRGECPKKKKLGQEIGKAAAEKSRGLFSADDWQCNKCGNVNWARRQQCNMCNAPKFGDVEERTGYGGGYNDRGVVEYKERREDDDDEYDEFGRRKKKPRMENRSDDDSKDSYSSPPRSRSKNSNRKDDELSDEKEEIDEKEEVDEDEEVKEKKEKEEFEENEDDEDEDEDDDDGDLSKYDLSEWDDLASVGKNTNGNVSSKEQKSS